MGLQNHVGSADGFDEGEQVREGERSEPGDGAG